MGMSFSVNFNLADAVEESPELVPDLVAVLDDLNEYTAPYLSDAYLRMVDDGIIIGRNSKVIRKLVGLAEFAAKSEALGRKAQSRREVPIVSQDEYMRYRSGVLESSRSLEVGISKYDSFTSLDTVLTRFDTAGEWWEFHSEVAIEEGVSLSSLIMLSMQNLLPQSKKDLLYDILYRYNQFELFLQILSDSELLDLCIDIDNYYSEVRKNSTPLVRSA